MGDRQQMKAFKKLTVTARYKRLKSEGEFIASRLFDSYHVHLFLLDDFYVEVWQKLGLSQIYWIEPVTSQSTLDNYLDQIDLESLKRDLPSA